MLKLKDVHFGTELSLDIVGYQFPHLPNDDWCLVSTKIVQDDEIFEVVDPALEMREVKWLLEWFTCLHQRKLPKRSTIGFIEPCLAFNFITSDETSVRIKIEFSHELKPHFPMKEIFIIGDNDEHEKEDDWYLYFDLTAEDFQSIITSLTNTLEKYPIRREK